MPIIQQREVKHNGLYYVFAIYFYYGCKKTSFESLKHSSLGLSTKSNVYHPKDHPVPIGGLDCTLAEYTVCNLLFALAFWGADILNDEIEKKVKHYINITTEINQKTNAVFGTGIPDIPRCCDYLRLTT